MQIVELLEEILTQVVARLDPTEKVRVENNIALVNSHCLAFITKLRCIRLKAKYDLFATLPATLLGGSQFSVGHAFWVRYMLRCQGQYAVFVRVPWYWPEHNMRSVSQLQV